MITRIACCLLTILLSLSASGAERYEPDWESLKEHQAAPEWFQDAKLGIYFHWGVYSVPAFANEWYPSLMHLPGTDVREYHLKTFGDPSRFGYHDFVPEFQAEKFDPADWAALFKRAGARFAGPVAEHHDGFAMWASKVTPWNAKDMGPKRDITGELATALRAEGMKLITTFHHARNLQRYPTLEMTPETKVNRNTFPHSHFANIAGTPPASTDPQLRLLYGNVEEEEWLETIWLGKLKEVIDGYRPDIVWFDSWLDQIPETYRQQFAAYYLNRAQEWGKEVVIVRKQEDLPIDFTVLDHEKSREGKATERVWMTDDTISTGSWCYTRGLGIKPFEVVLHALIDTVSKNGVVLLNLSPRADGVIPDNQREVLHRLGDWLAVHGEAIYETRPWSTSGEGPTTEPGSGWGNHRKLLDLRYTAKDVRYTRSKDGKTVFAILMGKPRGEVLLQTFAGVMAPVDSVALLGSKTEITHSVGADGLTLSVPMNEELDDHAVVYRIQLK